MKVPLNKQDPWAEIVEMLVAANPRLDPKTVRPYKLTAGTSRNTKLFLVGSSSVGVAGKLTIEYDRFDPADVFSRFGDLTKDRAIRLYGLPGKVMKLSEILQQVNEVLGVKLSMTSDFRDIIDRDITLPAKNAAVVVDIMPYVSATGELPINLRIMPSTKLSLSVINGGESLKLVNKGLNPFVKANGNLNWAFGERPLTDMSKSRDIALYNLDFSEMFGSRGLINGCYKPTPVVLPGYYQYGFTFRDEVVDRINPMLDSVGVKRLIKDRVHFVYTYTSGNIDITGNHQFGQGRTWAYTNSYMINNAAGDVGIYPTPPQVNKKFTHVFKVFPTDWPANTSYDDSVPNYAQLPEDKRMMYFHFTPL